MKIPTHKAKDERRTQKYDNSIKLQSPNSMDAKPSEVGEVSPEKFKAGKNVPGSSVLSSGFHSNIFENKHTNEKDRKSHEQQDSDSSSSSSFKNQRTAAFNILVDDDLTQGF